MSGRYDDIINMEHHVSRVHPPMSMRSRAAQFAPFAALSGHDEAIAKAESDHLSHYCGVDA